MYLIGGTTHLPHGFTRTSGVVMSNSVEDITDRLLTEIRQLVSIIDSLKEELTRCRDLDKLSLLGAISYLVTSRLTLNSIEQVLAHADQYPGDDSELIHKINSILESKVMS